MALGASLILRSVRGRRTIPLAEFYPGLRKPVMQPDEMLVDINFPALDPKKARCAFLRLTLRRAQAISVVNAAAVLYFQGEKIKEAVITLGSVAVTIVRAQKAEAYLKGRKLTQKNIEKAAELALEAAAPIDDVRSSAAYRREMVKVTVRRALTDLAAKKQPARIPARPVMLWGAPKKKTALNPSVQHNSESAIRTTIN